MGLLQSSCIRVDLSFEHVVIVVLAAVIVVLVLVIVVMVSL